MAYPPQGARNDLRALYPEAGYSFGASSPPAPVPAPRGVVVGHRLAGTHGTSPHGTGGIPRSPRTSLTVTMPYFMSISRSRKPISWLTGTGSSLARNSRPVGSYR